MPPALIVLIVTLICTSHTQEVTPLVRMPWQKEKPATKKTLGLSSFSLDEWRTGDTQTKERFAALWDEAMQIYGFALVRDHGVPEPVINTMYEKTVEFFDQDPSYKMRYMRDGPYGSPGFNPHGSESNGKVDEELPADLMESWLYWAQNETINREDGFLVPKDSATDPEVYDAASEYRLHFRDVLRTILDISDVALGLDGTLESIYFEGGPTTVLRMSNYFHINRTSNVKKGQERCGAHTDYMGFTILRVDDVGGLEVAMPTAGTHVHDVDGMPKPGTFEWHSVHAPPGTLIINAGDMIRYWTNGRWNSAFHRVIPQPNRRVSLVYFTGPNMSASTTPLNCTKCHGRPKYPDYVGKTMHYHVFKKMSRTSADK